MEAYKLVHWIPLIHESSDIERSTKIDQTLIDYKKEAKCTYY